MNNDTIAAHLAGLDGLIAAQVEAEVEKRLAEAHAALDARVANAVQSALAAIRTHLVTAAGALDNAIEACK